MSGQSMSTNDCQSCKPFPPRLSSHAGRVRNYVYALSMRMSVCRRFVVVNTVARRAATRHRRYFMHEWAGHSTARVGCVVCCACGNDDDDDVFIEPQQQRRRRHSRVSLVVAQWVYVCVWSLRRCVAVFGGRIGYIGRFMCAHVMCVVSIKRRTGVGAVWG